MTTPSRGEKLLIAIRRIGSLGMKEIGLSIDRPRSPSNGSRPFWGLSESGLLWSPGITPGLEVLRDVVIPIVQMSLLDEVEIDLLRGPDIVHPLPRLPARGKVVLPRLGMSQLQSTRNNPLADAGSG